ncbi:SUN domain-containing protein 3 [Coelomomyces lativittatus]|nr:SUN domain-containing protein 3 [Coelomomyces lativittatus]KAJ1518169.1 SUN domain-containing protein 3 [Coelomomyces lativittatus]KAJ1518632.1 SUN domain-containing protein 3 [Coelomomyces lativittatus]
MLFTSSSAEKKNFLATNTYDRSSSPLSKPPASSLSMSSTMFTSQVNDALSTLTYPPPPPSLISNKTLLNSIDDPNAFQNSHSNLPCSPQFLSNSTTMHSLESFPTPIQQNPSSLSRKSSTPLRDLKLTLEETFSSPRWNRNSASFSPVVKSPPSPSPSPSLSSSSNSPSPSPSLSHSSSRFIHFDPLNENIENDFTYEPNLHITRPHWLLSPFASHDLPDQLKSTPTSTHSSSSPSCHLSPTPSPPTPPFIPIPPLTSSPSNHSPKQPYLLSNNNPPHSTSIPFHVPSSPSSDLERSFPTSKTSVNTMGGQHPHLSLTQGTEETTFPTTEHPSSFSIHSSSTMKHTLPISTTLLKSVETFPSTRGLSLPTDNPLFSSTSTPSMNPIKSTSLSLSKRRFLVTRQPSNLMTTTPSAGTATTGSSSTTESFLQPSSPRGTNLDFTAEWTQPRHKRYFEGGRQWISKGTAYVREKTSQDHVILLLLMFLCKWMYFLVLLCTEKIIVPMTQWHWSTWLGCLLLLSMYCVDPNLMSNSFLLTSPELFNPSSSPPSFTSSPLPHSTEVSSSSTLTYTTSSSSLQPSMDVQPILDKYKHVLEVLADHVSLLETMFPSSTSTSPRALVSSPSTIEATFWLHGATVEALSPTYVWTPMHDPSEDRLPSSSRSSNPWFFTSSFLSRSTSPPPPPSSRQHVRQGYPPSMLLMSDQSPGQCWASTLPAEFTLHFSVPIRPTHVDWSHVTLQEVPNVRSAPKWISFYHPSGPRLLHVEFKYPNHSFHRTQRFPFPLSHQGLDKIRVVVENNHGHPDYVCIYRVRIDGVPVLLERNEEN